MRSDTPRVTVVMTAHNTRPYVAEAVTSIQVQDFHDWELVVVDDASTDGTGEVLEDFARQDGRIVVLRRDRPGRCEALNLAVARASGELLAVLDADDVAAPDRLRKQVALLDARPDLVAVGGAARVRALDRPTDVVMRPPLDPGRIASLLPRTNCIIHSASMARRAAVVAAGGYRPMFRLCQDYDLWLRLSEQGLLLNLPDIVVEYRLHATQVTTTKLRKAALMHLAVQRATALRRSGRREPTVSAGAADAEVMRAFGIGARELEQTTLRLAVEREQLLRHIGMSPQADGLVAGLLASDGWSMDHRSLRIELDWHRAQNALEARDWSRVLSALGRAVLLAPGAQTRRLARSLVDRFSAGRANGPSRR